MSKKLYVKLQTPTIELGVTAKDSSGLVDKLTVGFKRPERKVADALYEQFADLSDIYVKQLLGQPLGEKGTKENQFTVEYTLEEKEGITEQISAMILNSIVYLKEAKVLVVDDEKGSESYLTIPDTRKAKPNEDFWEDKAGCLAALLDMYLDASPWRSSLTSAYQKSLLNVDTSEAKRKN